MSSNESFNFYIFIRLINDKDMVFMPRSPILLFDKLILMFCRHFNVSRDENFNVFSVNVFPIKFNLSE